MINFKVEVQGINAIRANLQGQGKQVRYAASRALNTLAFALRADFGDAMQRTFKGGATPWTRRAFRVRKASRDDLTAVVELNPFDGNKSSTYEKILGHLFTGGTRRFKRMEGAFRRIGVLPDGYIMVPGGACPLDGFGNPPSALINQLISYFGGFGEQGYRANMTDKRKATIAKRGTTAGGYKTINGMQYFVSRGPGTWFGRPQHLPAGIWAKRGIHGSDVQPIFMFVRAGSYQRTIDLERLAKPIIDQRFQPEFERELKTALRNAR